MGILQGKLADRDSWSAVGRCPIENAMALVGTKSAMLIMREAYYGTTRFEDFWRRVGVTKAAASTRLADLVEAGLLERRPYQEPGQRSRDEYVLTRAGTDFMPVVWALFEWGRHHVPNNSPLRLAHADCGAQASVEIRCAQGHVVPADELVIRVASPRPETSSLGSSAPAPATPR